MTDIIDQLGNDKCADCGSLGAEWASVSFGICVCTKCVCRRFAAFVGAVACFEVDDGCAAAGLVVELHRCSGRHRGLGSHITRVRSLVLDTWGGQDIAKMLRGGNIKFIRFLEEHGLRDLIFEHKYRHPRVLYFKVNRSITTATTAIFSTITNHRCLSIAQALLQAELDQAPPPPYVEERYALSDSNTAITMAKSAKAPPQWVPDTSTSGCMICQKSFTLLFRRHHCRRCGKCVCMECAPKENARPILEWGMTTPVRHCKQCFKSPTLEWSEPSPSSSSSRHSR